MSEREYIITLNDYSDLDSFYEDMETPGGSLYIPDRAVPVKDRRPISRNTHYRLTEEEADTIRLDPRVLAVELSLDEQGLHFIPNWTETSTSWDKSNIIQSSNINWGLLRCIEGVQRAGWGSDGTSSQSGTASTTSSGKNVDVVIVDGHMNPAHPEFAVNSDGTGGSRVVQYNWFQLNPLVTGTPASTYVYTPYVDYDSLDSNSDGITNLTDDNDHGTHVAGTACGNRQGWARSSTIYNINPYPSNPSYSPYLMDYVRAWHATKPINPTTGFKNPTITNHSYGLGFAVAISTITSVRYQGIIYAGPFTQSQLQSYGIYSSAGTAYIPARSIAYEQDFLDAITEGILVIGAAGNQFTKISNYSIVISDDYNNYAAVGSLRYYYNRGTISSAIGVLCVGAIGTAVNDSKVNYSNSGPRIDIYAPGRFIMSSINSSLGPYVTDPRNTSYNITKKGGTSMASPQVAGVLACLAESHPRLTQAQAINYLFYHAKVGQITDTAGGPTDLTALQGSANRFLFYYKDRPETGNPYPKSNQGLRPNTGQAWPRSKIFRYGR